MTIHHLTLAVRGRRALAPDETKRRELMRSLATTGSSRVLLYSLVDEHLHAAIRALKPGYVARDLGRVIRELRPDLELKQPHIEPVGTRAYLRWLVRYLLAQPAKHGLPDHPALWTGSGIQDLVGARLLPGFDRRLISEELPRLRLRECFEFVGLEPVRLVPASDDALRRLGAARLIELAAGVFAVGPDLRQRTRSRGVERARALAAQSGALAGVPASEVAHYLGTLPRAVRQLARRAPDRPGLRALRLRHALVERAGGQLSRS